MCDWYGEAPYLLRLRLLILPPAFDDRLLTHKTDFSYWKMSCVGRRYAALGVSFLLIRNTLSL